ncbi:DUF397 domain-containing protein [Nocardia sp. CC227C]|uniref:DUF397 domain-containing protein n=1 Tax=Nocardia sp. CC227C TaxID=3044562 RepID=UPI00278BBAC4|nr:DUF397 domain-containing protein [Nocardia sp. CC227C]
MIRPDSGTAWFKSSHSGATSDCVEIAWLPEDHVGVRDSKNPTGPALVFAPGVWDAFAASTARGEFDRPA